MADPEVCPRHGRELMAECVKFQRKFCAECFADPATREEAVCLSANMHCQFRPSCLVWELSKESRRKKRAAG